MIHFSDIEKRKEAAHKDSVLTNEPLLMVDSVVEIAKVRGSWRFQHERLKGYRRGTFGRCKVSGGRWFWVLVLSRNWRVYGFAATESQAQADAKQVVSEDYPQGVRFVFRPGEAAWRYQGSFAKPSTFASDWRSRFPFWAERTHLYHYDYAYDEYQFERPTECTIAIVAVTEKKVFVHRLQKTQLSADDIKGIRRQDCYSFDRLELETQGKAWHHKLFATYYVERDPAFLNWEPPRQKMQPRIEELRRMMQKEHPDRGGNVELFMAAQKEYKSLRATLTNGERVAATGGRA